MGAARQVGGLEPSIDVSGDELDGFVSEFPPQLLKAVPAYPPPSIPDDTIDDDGSDDAVVRYVPPQPKWRPFRTLASALWRAMCAIAYAPVALVVFVATRSWRLCSWVVTGIWRGITGVVRFVTSIVRACAHAIARTIAATARFCVAIARAIAYAPVALVLFIVALVRSIVAACVRAVMRVVVAIRTFCLSVVHAVAAGVRTTITACVNAVRSVAQGIRNVVTGVLAFVTSMINACVRAVVGTVVATGALCVAVANAVAAGVRAVAAFVTSSVRACVHAVVRAVVATGAFCALVAHAVAAGALALVTAIVGACVYAVVWVVVVARTLCVLGVKAIRAGARETRSRVRLIGAGITLASRHFATSVRASATAAARAGEAGAERAILAGGRSVARSTTAMASGVSALRSGTQVAAATTARRAQAAGHTWWTAVSDGIHGLRARAAVFKVTVRAGIASTVPAEGAWSRRAVVAPAIGAVLLAAAATASTVLVISRLPGVPGRQVAVPAAAIGPLSTPAASIAPTVSQPPARLAVRRPATARVNMSDDAAANISTRSIDAKKMRALWLKADTRSLDRALSTVRQSTLAFESCNVQVTQTDQAVAHCELASTGGTANRKTGWTIDFSRSDDRWSIDRITEASSGQPRR